VKFVTRSTRFDNQAYERELSSLVAEMGLTDAAQFLAERADVDRLMACHDVLLVPSNRGAVRSNCGRDDGDGVPVIATDTGGPAEILRPGWDGVALPPDDIEAWAHANAALTRRGRCSASPA